MIYLRNIPESQLLFLPKSGATPSGDLVFKAKSTIDHDTEINEVMLDLQTSDLYYNLAISLPEDVPNGEYEYTLQVGDIVLSSGLLVIGENYRPSEYHKDITYEQYEIE